MIYKWLFEVLVWLYIYIIWQNVCGHQTISLIDIFLKYHGHFKAIPAYTLIRLFTKFGTVSVSISVGFLCMCTNAASFWQMATLLLSSIFCARAQIHHVGMCSLRPP